MKKWIIPVLLIASIAAIATSCRSSHPANSTGNVVFKFHIPPAFSVRDGSIDLVGADDTTLGNFECVLPTQTRIAVPAGAYTISNAEFSVSDKSGISWKSHFDHPNPIVVASGKDTQIEIGIPVTAQIAPDAEPLSRSNDARLWLKLEGIGGELYESIAMKNSRMMPSVKLISSDGVVAAEANMEYG